MRHPDAARFLTIPQVAEDLATSPAQIRALIKRGELEAIQIGGRGQWRIDRSKLEAYIQKAYEETQRELRQQRKQQRQMQRQHGHRGDLDYQSGDEDSDYRQEEGGEA